MGAAYYDYQNIRARPSTGGNQSCANITPDQQQSVPQFMQGGNSLTSICGYTPASGGAPIAGGLAGLASDYKILDINGQYDLAMFAPIHVKVGADFAKNIGYSLIKNNAQLLVGDGHRHTTAWQVKVDVGWSKLNTFGNWNIFTGYRYVESDAVLDAYTDSDFHNGGTNVKGWMVGGNYALVKNVWLTGRWMSGDIITLPTPTTKYGLDVMQLDLNTRF